MSRPRHRSLALLGVLAALAGAPGCTDDEASQGVSESPPPTPTDLLVDRLAQDIYNYCVDTLERGRSRGADRAAVAIEHLKREYRRVPSTAPGRGRSLVRQALEKAQRQLRTCDPRLAREVSFFLTGDRS